MTTTLHVTTGDGGRELNVTERDATLPLSTLLAQRGLPLNTRCGGRGLCAGCEVEVLTGKLLPLNETPAASMSAPRRIKACQHRLGAALEVCLAIPPRSQLTHTPAVVAEFQLGASWAQDPLGNRARCGAAVDIGTTTVALLLCDLATGVVLAQASAFNAQLRDGEDVLTRIQACSTRPDALARLQRAVATETIQPLLADAASRADVSLADIDVMTVAANTTMIHLLAGIDPTPLGVHPFTPVFLDHRVYAPATLGFAFGSQAAEVHLLPGPAAYVGADLAAGLVATGMIYEDGPSLLVDVGTNGEIIAKLGDRLVGCATAAGPAFEGAGLSSGTRGVAGAIERVQLTTNPFRADLGLIGGGARPLGLCGSAYIDLLWEGRRAGILKPNGRFSAEFCASAGDVVQSDEYGRKLLLHAHGLSGPIWISEVDIARLLQAKAAVAAGITTLLDLLGLQPRNLRTVHLAGGFGLHLSLPHAIGCGLLPGFTPEQIKVDGNTSLGGAFLALNDRSLLAEMSAACRAMESIELNLQPGFEDAYIDHLALP